MTAYRELVQRVIAAKHADLELGMSRAREQEGFVLNVSRLLDKTGWPYRVKMDNRFEVRFEMKADLDEREHRLLSVGQILAAVYEVYFNGGELEIASIRPDGYSCRVVFGDVS